MTIPDNNTSLGFTKEPFPAGIHMCLFYSKEEETEAAYHPDGYFDPNKMLCRLQTFYSSSMEGLLRCEGNS